MNKELIFGALALFVISQLLTTQTTIATAGVAAPAPSTGGLSLSSPGGSVKVILPLSPDFNF